MPGKKKKLSSIEMSNLAGNLNSHYKGAGNPLGENMPNANTNPKEYMYWNRWHKEQVKQKATGFNREPPVDPEPKKPVKDFGDDMVGQSHQRTYEAEQKREARRNGNLGSIYQTGDRIINSANRIGENAVNKLEETGETIRNIGSNIGDKVKKKIKK